MAESNPLEHQETEEQNKDIIEAVSVALSKNYSGPIPPPEMLEGYEQISPGFANRIIAMAEEQGKHRREMESRVIKRDSLNSTLGIITAFLICMGAIGAGTYVISQGFSWPGTVFGTSGMVGLATVFIYGTNQRRKEREAKSK